MDGIYLNPDDETTLVQTIGGKDAYELTENIEEHKKYCIGASRAGANGARAKLEYVKDAAAQGTTIYIANAKYSIAEVLSDSVPCTKIGVEL